MKALRVNRMVTLKKFDFRYVLSHAKIGQKKLKIVQKALLVCGIVSSLLYVAATILGAMQWPGYSSVDQSVSELIGINAHSAPVVVPLFLIYSILIFAFGLGVWRSAGQKRTLRVVAVLVAGKEVLGIVATLFAPMHLRGMAGTLTDTMHAVLTGVGVLLCMFPAMGFGAASFGKRFRLYSIVTMLIFLVFGALGGMEASRMAANLPTPWLGVWERINIFGYMLWIVVLAINLLYTQPEILRLEATETITHPAAVTNRS